MNIPLFARKLSLKIGVTTAILSWLSIEIVVQLVLQQASHQHRISIQRDLCNLVAVSARAISGDDHAKAMSPLPEAQQYFERVRRQMNMLRIASKFQEHWYTFLPSLSDTVQFAIMTHAVPFSGDKHIFRDTNVSRLFQQTLRTKQAVVTDIYRDDHGIWISGLAPIQDSIGQIVAVLEIDLTYRQYEENEREMLRDIAYIRVIGFFVGGLLGILLGVIIASPIKKVTDAVTRITNNNFHGAIDVPKFLHYYPDETATLVHHVNTMSATLEETLGNLRQANERLRTLDYAKSTFLQFIAHELRTPLMPLLSLSILAEDTDLSSDKREFLQASIDSVERLRLFSQAAEQYIRALTHTPIFEEHIAIDENLGAMIEEYRLEYGSPQLLFTIQPKNTTSSTEHSDTQWIVSMPHHIVQVILSTLLDNAFQFGNHGDRIEVHLERNESHITCSIRDFGVGFEKNNGEHLFAPFFVEDILHHQQGVGVNLAIAQIYAQHYGGYVTAYSEGKEQGSTFTAAFIRTA